MSGSTGPRPRDTLLGGRKIAGDHVEHGDTPVEGTDNTLCAENSVQTAGHQGRAIDRGFLNGPMLFVVPSPGGSYQPGPDHPGQQHGRDEDLIVDEDEKWTEEEEAEQIAWEAWFYGPEQVALRSAEIDARLAAVAKANTNEFGRRFDLGFPDPLVYPKVGFVKGLAETKPEYWWWATCDVWLNLGLSPIDRHIGMLLTEHWFAEPVGDRTQEEYDRRKITVQVRTLLPVLGISEEYFWRRIRHIEKALRKAGQTGEGKKIPAVTFTFDPDPAKRRTLTVAFCAKVRSTMRRNPEKQHGLGYLAVPRAVMFDPWISNTVRETYLFLIKWAVTKGARDGGWWKSFYASHEALADHMGLSERTVRTRMNEVVASGLVRRLDRPSKRAASVYEFVPLDEVYLYLLHEDDMLAEGFHRGRYERWVWPSEDHAQDRNCRTQSTKLPDSRVETAGLGVETAAQIEPLTTEPTIEEPTNHEEIHAASGGRDSLRGEP